MMTRREFMARSAGVGAAASIAAAKAPEVRRLKYLGWQVGVTYQTSEPGGLDRDHFMRLLDEMAQNRMNLLSLMMQSYGYFDPNHDGYAWPVRKDSLQAYRDEGAINARPDTEFIQAVIAAAADRAIEVQLFLNWGIWNPERIRAAYPSATLQIDRDSQPAGWLHCPDAPGAWQLGLDEVSDLLTFYNHPNVTSYAFERVSYAGTKACFCPHTRERFLEDTGTPLDKAAPSRINAWKTDRISARIEAYVAHVRRLRPGIAVGLHTQCARGWGHDPARLKTCGIDYVLPHTIQFPQTRDEVHAMIARLAPNPCVLHFCTRDIRPANYNLWIKTPAIIADALKWIFEYPGDNLAGLLFFNEPATSPTNKQAVYDGVKAFV
ncbi:MAG TPA: hypothetical protein PLO37_24330 [Candidatus Hydrogenedentes bacterium]|nr:hypothetical protein [Candidatus Hydrogenedentota bacterium]HPG69992.1 hypothetical protein [Candidatus Hydrogenedentota bacterium]